MFIMNLLERTCSRCRTSYIPSATSDPSLCGACASSPGSDIQDSGAFSPPARGRYRVEAKTPLIAQMSPESWGRASGQSCECSVCGEIFNSLHGFDTHRYGKLERFCLTPEEMRKSGMSINSRGRWITQEFNHDVFRAA